jgi:tripartite ATP-independent transporter DctM subunit
VDALILLVSFLVLMFVGIPVAYAMGLATLVTALWIDMPLEAVMLKISDGMDDFALLTIPFFVLAGAIMSEGGVARRLVDLAKVFVGFMRGGLALVNVLASTLFGCLSGSSVADTASVGSVMIPQMVRNGYSKVFATNVTICGSVQAILVPPSHNSVIYSIATGGTVSIAALFMAGVFPGLLFGMCLVGLILWKARTQNFPTERVVPLREAL